MSNRIKIAERQVKKLVSEEFTTPSPTHRRSASAADAEDPEASRRRETAQQDAGSDDDDEEDEDEGDTLATDDESVQSVDALEEQFHFLEEEVATLVADVHDLALYTKLNITGFMKILKVRSSVCACVVLPLSTRASVTET